MPPAAGRKSPKNEKNSERKKELLSAKERIMKIKRNTLKIVELMLEDNISKEWFLQNCGTLCQDDYQDVIQERSIEHLCGYPLCNKPLKNILKQQYRISRATNKVYDLTERKCFCSNECYKASNFLKAQLPQIPLYMRKTEDPITVNLLQNCDNEGSAGEEIIFHHYIKKDEIEQVPSDIAVPSNHLSNILQEEIKGCEEHLSKLKITENIYEKPYVFGVEVDNGKKSSDQEDKSNSESSDQDDSETEELDKKLFPAYDNMSVLSNKHMPINDKSKKAVFIPPLKRSNVTTTPGPLKLCIEFIRNIFQDWFSEDTMKYLLGEKEMYSLKADLLFQTMIDDDSSSEKISVAKNEYIDLCLKIDQLQQEELSDSLDLEIEDVSIFPEKNEIISNSSSKVTQDSSSGPASSNHIPKRKPRRKSKGKNKTVSFAQDMNKKNEAKEKLEEPLEESKITESSLPEPAFPLVDSLSQNTLRRQVLGSKLKAVYFDVLPIIGLHYRDIREGVHKIIDTFSLTPTNITYKPKEFKCIAVTLFRLLTKTTLNELQEDTKFLKLCQATTEPLNVSTQEIEDLVCDLISKNQLLRLQGAYEVK